MFARVALPEFDVADEEAGKETGERESEEVGKETGKRESEEASKENESEKEVSESPNRASALAELAALAENVERCRERIVALPNRNDSRLMTQRSQRTMMVC